MIKLKQTKGLLLALIIITQQQLIAQTAGNINTLAGTGEAGYNGDGINATEAILYNAEGVAVDASGNIFVTDRQNYRIRKIDAATGLISTIAGDGISSNSGDDGQAVDAQVHYPYGIAVDVAGNIYFTEYFYQVVRKINVSTGIISRVAGTPGIGGYTGDGGLATSAKLSGPKGLTITANGDIFIADMYNDAIRKIDAISGNISTVAGDGTGVAGFSGDGGLATSAKLYIPHDVAFDSNGDMFIADFGNKRIRKVDMLSGNISTIAGNGSFGDYYNGEVAAGNPMGLVNSLFFDNSDNLYYTDNNYGKVKKINVSDGTLSAYAGSGTGYSDGALATSVGLGQLTALTIVNGIMYINERAKHRVLKVNMSTNVITSVAGTGGLSYSGDNGPAVDARLNYPTGVAVDEQGNLYIADASNYCIRKVNKATGVITTIAGTPGSVGYSGDGGQATAALLSYSEGGITLDAEGNIYFVDSENNIIRKIDANTNIISTVVGTPEVSGYSGDGGLATNAELDYPMDMVFDSQGNMYIMDGNNNVIRKIDTNGIISTVAGIFDTWGYSGDGGLATVATFDWVEGLGIDGNDNLYIADADNNVVRKIDASTWVITRFAGNGGIGLAVGDGGPATEAEVYYPTDVAADAAGNVYIMDDNYIIRKVDADGTISTVAGDAVSGNIGFSGDGGSAMDALLDYAEGLAVDLFGNVYIAGSNNDRVRYIHYCTGPTRAVVEATQTTTCSEDVVTLSVTSGTLNDATAWNWYSGSCGGTPFSTGVSIDVSPAVTTTYYVRGEGNCVVAGTCSTITITVNPLPVVVANATSEAVCDGSEVTLTGSGDTASYSWDNSVTDGVPFVPTATATYTVTATDGNDCQSTSDVMVVVNELPIATIFASSTETCTGSGEEITFVAYGNTAGTFSWDNGVTNGVAFIPTATTTYTVTMTDLNGCVDTGNVTFTINELPVIPEVTESNGELTTGNYDTYQWMLSGQPIVGATAQNYIPEESGDYTVEVANIHGCVAISNAHTFTITSLDEIPELVSYKIYPNPVFDKLQLQLQLKNHENVIYRLLDFTGSELMYKDVINTNVLNEQINVAGYKQGLYYLQVSVGGSTYTKKIVKK